MAKQLPERQARSWFSEENEVLRTAFLAGEATRTLAVAYKRTRGAIKGRLRRPGPI